MIGYCREVTRDKDRVCVCGRGRTEGSGRESPISLPQHLARPFCGLPPLSALPGLRSVDSFVVPDPLSIPPVFKIHAEPGMPYVPGSGGPQEVFP